jgi:hypothetical protein
MYWVKSLAEITLGVSLLIINKNESKEKAKTKLLINEKMCFLDINLIFIQLLLVI